MVLLPDRNQRRGLVRPQIGFDLVGNTRPEVRVYLTWVRARGLGGGTAEERV